LKNFFSPQLAESITNGGGEDLLKTHRREVVVAFLDMRGFTEFTDRSEPEEVMSVLADYHRAMGPLILEHQGTLERFAGDGMMIFFNDPIRLENPGQSTSGRRGVARSMNSMNRSEHGPTTRATIVSACMARSASSPRQRRAEHRSAMHALFLPHATPQ
jgi:class 3 adenylate cyclase